MVNFIKCSARLHQDRNSILYAVGATLHQLGISDTQ